MHALTDNQMEEAIVEFMISEAVKTSEIEGEFIIREDIRSSIKKNLGFLDNSEPIRDQRAIGIPKLMYEVPNSLSSPLSTEMLQSCHNMLMFGNRKINIGAWRTGTEPMYIISGSLCREKIHFEAPPASEFPEKMDQFIHWYNTSQFPLKGDLAISILKSTISHIYFESIHPFEDGNGRIGRAIAEKALSQALGSPVMLSLSKAIEKNKPAYYNALKLAQVTLDITDWIQYFASIILEAQKDVKKLVLFTLKKSKFYDQYSKSLNKRQLKAIHKMFELWEDGYEGGMTAKKYISICKTSKPTATRDLQSLFEKKAFSKTGAGRSVSYDLNFD